MSYIKREDAIEAVKRLSKNYTGKGKRDYHPHIDFVVDEIKYEVPSADVVERKRGEWQITDPYPHNVYCSNCYKTFAQSHWAVWEDGTLPRSYCPNCGADMRGENNG